MTPKFNPGTLKLSTRLLLVTIGIVLLTAVMSQTYFVKHERVTLQKRLGEKVAFVNNFYAFLIAESIQRQDDVTLQEIIDRLHKDPEITEVSVVDGEGKLRYHADPSKIETDSDDPDLKEVLKTGEAKIRTLTNSGGKALALLTPLKVQGEASPIGAIRIDMTYKYIDEQVRSSQGYFALVVLGMILIGTMAMFWIMNRWVLVPLYTFQNTLARLHADNLEIHLDEDDTEFGQMRAALNEFALRIRSELQTRDAEKGHQAEDERRWIEQLARSFFPESRVIITDEENRVLSDSRPEPGAEPSPHLLDLIADDGFATLLNSAFEKEGETVGGAVTHNGQPFYANILRVKPNESQLVKTLIRLRPA